MAETNIKKMMRALIGPFQTAEDTLQTMIVGLRIDDAVGAQLDVLGKIVGELRNGQEDEPYRRFIRARVATNNSDGVVEDAISVSKLVIGDAAARMRVRRLGTAQFEIEIRDVVVDTPVAAILLSFAQAAAGAGIRVAVVYWVAVESELFTLKAFPGEAQLGKGLGSTLDATVGGVLAGAIG